LAAKKERSDFPPKSRLRRYLGVSVLTGSFHFVSLAFQTKGDRGNPESIRIGTEEFVGYFWSQHEEEVFIDVR